MQVICCLSLLHTFIPLQRTGFPSGRIFLHISKETGYLFFSWVTELRQALKRTGRQGGSQQRSAQAEEAAAVAKPVCGPARSLFAVPGGGGHPAPAAPGTPGPAVTQLEEEGGERERLGWWCVWKERPGGATGRQHGRAGRGAAWRGSSSAAGWRRIPAPGSVLAGCTQGRAPGHPAAWSCETYSPGSVVLPALCGMARQRGEKDCQPGEALSASPPISF